MVPQTEVASASDVEYSNDTIDPLSEQNNRDGIRSCSGRFESDNMNSYVDIQTNTDSVNRSIQWGFFIRPQFHYLYQNDLQVGIQHNAMINGEFINSPYPFRPGYPSYTFHGSIKNYQVTGLNKALKKGDIIEINFLAMDHYFDPAETRVPVECKVL